MADFFRLHPYTFQAPTLNRRGEIIHWQNGQSARFSDDLGNEYKLLMVAIPGGAFQMGSLRGSTYPDETPIHPVSLPAFYLAQHPLTQAQWQAVIPRLPPCRFRHPLLPVENVSWADAQDFCQHLSRKTGRSYRLPSEAEWEYACRAGSPGPFCTGDTITTEQANYCGEHIFLEEPKGLYRHATTPSGTFPPNLFGLEDVHGNLWEWCADRWHNDYQGAPFDGSAWEHAGEPGYRVARGGSWHEPAINCRSAVRLRVSEKERDDFYGFRLALSDQEG